MRFARRSARSQPVTSVSEAGSGAAPVEVKAGRHREASLYHALAGAGAGDGRSLDELRAAALEVYESSELPVWRRSGFWTTSLQSLDLDSLTLDGPQERAERGEMGVIPAIVGRAIARQAAGRPDRAGGRRGGARRARPGARRGRRDPLLAGGCVPAQRTWSRRGTPSA